MSNRGASTKKMVFGALIAALSTALLLMTGVIPIATIAIPAIAGCLTIPVVIEAGKKWAVAIYFVCSILSLVLASDKEAVLFYILFFGYYPILYALMGRIREKVLRVIVKLLIFNVAVVLESLISIYILNIPLDFIEKLGVLTVPILLVLANVVFLLYDSALDGIIATYVRRFHTKIHKMFRF